MSETHPTRLALNLLVEDRGRLSYLIMKLPKDQQEAYLSRLLILVNDAVSTIHLYDTWFSTQWKVLEHELNTLLK